MAAGLTAAASAPKPTQLKSLPSSHQLQTLLSTHLTPLLMFPEGQWCKGKSNPPPDHMQAAYKHTPLHHITKQQQVQQQLWIQAMHVLLRCAGGPFGNPSTLGRQASGSAAIAPLDTETPQICGCVGFSKGTSRAALPVHNRSYEQLQVVWRRRNRPREVEQVKHT